MILSMEMVSLVWSPYIYGKICVWRLHGGCHGPGNTGWGVTILLVSELKVLKRVFKCFQSDFKAYFQKPHGSMCACLFA